MSEKKSLTRAIFPMNESPVCVLVCVCVCAVVPRASGRLHPAGVGKGSRVSVGQQPCAGRRVSFASGESLQSAGGDSQPRPLRWVNTPVAPVVCCFCDKPASSRFAGGQTNCWPQPDLRQQRRKTSMTFKKQKLSFTCLAAALCKHWCAQWFIGQVLICWWSGIFFSIWTYQPYLHIITLNSNSESL